MGTGGEGAQLRHAPRRGLNRTRGFVLCYFSLSGLLSLETLSGGMIAKHMMHQPREAESYVTPRNSQVDYDNE